MSTRTPASETLRDFADLCEANSGSSRFPSGRARALLARGWIERVNRAVTGNHGWDARYRFTTDGLAALAGAK